MCHVYIKASQQRGLVTRDVPRVEAVVKPLVSFYAGVFTWHSDGLEVTFYKRTTNIASKPATGSSRTQYSNDGYGQCFGSGPAWIRKKIFDT
jgi:hypothetical protein